MSRIRWWLAPLIAVPVAIVAIVFLGPLAGFLISIGLLIAMPFLFRKSPAPAPGPGASSPGEPGYGGSFHVGDDSGLVD